MQKKSEKNIDVAGFHGGGWVYSKTVHEHFLHPKNIALNGKPSFKANGIGMVGSPACGDMMKFWIYIDPKTEKIKKCAWQTFGCASAIASTSMLSVMITKNDGLSLEKALKITPKDIIKKLGGLPDRKVHCSVLGDRALREAINNYFFNSKQTDKMKEVKAKVIDKVLGITDKDIEQAVLDGARTLSEVQHKTKVGLGDKNCLPEVVTLIEFFKEKHEL